MTGAPRQYLAGWPARLAASVLGILLLVSWWPENVRVSDAVEAVLGGHQHEAVDELESLIPGDPPGDVAWARLETFDLSPSTYPRLGHLLGLYDLQDWEVRTDLPDSTIRRGFVVGIRELLRTSRLFDERSRRALQKQVRDGEASVEEPGFEPPENTADVQWAARVLDGKLRVARIPAQRYPLVASSWREWSAAEQAMRAFLAAIGREELAISPSPR